MHLSAALPAVVLALTLTLAGCSAHHDVTFTTAPITLPSPLPSMSPAAVDADCGAHPPVARPSAIDLACTDGSLRLEHITYTTWGPAAATGTAVLHANTCRPDCAHGSFRDYPAAMTLGREAGHGDTDAFTEVTLTYAGAGPDGRAVATYPIQ